MGLQRPFRSKVGLGGNGAADVGSLVSLDGRHGPAVRAPGGLMPHEEHRPPSSGMPSSLPPSGSCRGT